MSRATTVPAMPPRATGRIEGITWADGVTVTWKLRIRAYGRRHTILLGTNHEGWSEERAQVRLDEVMAEVRRGTWRPDTTSPAAKITAELDAEARAGETIHVTLSRWWQKKKTEIEENTRADYEWRLRLILSFRPKTPTAEIDTVWVDELRDHLAAQKARNRKQGTLSPRSVNMCLEVLAAALDLAIRHKLLPANPVRTKGTKMKVKKSPRSFLEPDMVVDLLDIAGAWEKELADRNRPFECYGRRELLALLCLGGPRISEALTADRGEFDLTGGDHWRIPASKTPAGARTVDLTAFCAAELRGHLAAAPSRHRQIKARGPMWPTRNRTRMTDDNVRRMLREVVKRTNDRRAEEGKMLLPRVTPHALRRTFASLCFLAGRDPAWVMGQMGHTDARLTLAVYAQTIQRKRVDRDLVWELMRFADEPERWPGRPGIDPMIDPTGQDGSADCSARMRRG